MTDAEASSLFPLWAWLVFFGLVLGLLFLDLFVLHREAWAVPFREAMWLSVFWIVVSLAFGGFVWFLAGAEGAAADGKRPKLRGSSGSPGSLVLYPSLSRKARAISGM